MNKPVAFQNSGEIRLIVSSAQCGEVIQQGRTAGTAQATVQHSCRRIRGTVVPVAVHVCCPQYRSVLLSCSTIPVVRIKHRRSWVSVGWCNGDEVKSVLPLVAKNGFERFDHADVCAVHVACGVRVLHPKVRDVRRHFVGVVKVDGDSALGCSHRHPCLRDRRHHHQQNSHNPDAHNLQFAHGVFLPQNGMCWLRDVTRI